MKNSIILVLAILGVASFALAYESELEDHGTSAYESEMGVHERRLLWFKKKDYVDIYQRCCLQTDEVLASMDSPCKCPKRTETSVRWWWFFRINVKSRFEKSCSETGSIYRKGKIADFSNAEELNKGDSIVDIAIAATGSNSSEFNTLVELVVAADLAGTLSGPGPFTVLAPTDAAFDAALVALGISKDDLVADTELLTDVLLCHVVAGNAPSSGLSDGQVETVNAGKDVTISVDDDGIKINGNATVVVPDILASNGIIHVIDKVLNCDGGTFA